MTNDKATQKKIYARYLKGRTADLSRFDKRSRAKETFHKRSSQRPSSHDAAERPFVRLSGAA